VSAATISASAALTSIADGTFEQQSMPLESQEF
jgi:hypothetical protein